ncbi:hypothetical protein B0T16DRAFT_89671 [Cercophora newfieldiana]|uniref:Chromo domain-containing protein n=1 Tax=Cercophora newfieldiana TaxID=92897 RepID=A0AA39YFW0_9PEZI|nr:hypothetical protein B0T16DRAFT_89671 [Cercophora newfieldiana]
MTKRLAATKSLRRPKKRKQSRATIVEHDDSDDVLYTIRDIIDETEDGKGNLKYLIDWADDPRTGESYDPSWEPAENATEVAVRDWELAKQRKEQERRKQQQHGEDSESDSQPVRDPNWRAGKRRARSSTSKKRPSKRSRISLRQEASPAASTTSEGSDFKEEWAFVEAVPRRSEVVLDIPDGADFDRSEYAVVPPSQPTQSSQTNQLSQPSKTGDGQTAEDQQNCRVIPDSQGLTDSLPSIPAAEEFQLNIQDEDDLCAQESQPLAQDLLQPGVDEVRPSSQSSAPGLHTVEPDIEEAQLGSQLDSQTLDQDSLEVVNTDRLSQHGQEIPSHQPDHLRQDSPHLCPLNEPGTTSSGELALSLGFLTQEELDLPPLVPISSSRASGSAVSTPARTHSQEADDQNLVISATSSQQAAQILPQLATQSQVSLNSSGEVIPETVKKSTGKNPSQREQTPAPSESRGGYEHAQNSNTTLSTINSAGDPSLDEPSQRQHVATTPDQPTTPQRAIMDGSPATETPRSAIDELREKKASFFNQPLPSESSPSPPSEFVHPQAMTLASPSRDESHSAPEDGIGLGLSSVESAPEINASPSRLVHERPDLDFEQIPTTVAPLDLLTSTDHGSIAHLLPAKSHLPLAEVVGRSTPHRYLEDDFEDDREKREFLITLPLAANSRDRYLRLISEEKATIIEFADIFTTTLSGLPDPDLVGKMDTVFEKLFDICDVPPYAEDVPGLTSKDMVRHATNTNSKFSFTYELLLGLKGLDMRVLILARPGLAFNYLDALVTTGEWDSMVLGRDDPMAQTADDLMVILAGAHQDLTAIRQNVDVVILFDDSARSAILPPSLGYKDMAPLLLSLVATHCVDHINSEMGSQLGQKMDPLERKSALISAVVTARDHLKSPDFRAMDGDYPEPHVAAEIFANFLRDPGAGDLNWTHQQLPEDIFDVWASQREPESDIQNISSDEPNNRKRRLHQDDFEEGDSKRLRILDLRPAKHANAPVMSDLLKKTLAGFPFGESATETDVVEVSVRQLELMAAKIADMEDRLATQSVGTGRLREHAKSLEAQVRSHERTARVISNKYKEALGDRGTFEHQAKLAEEKASKAQNALEAVKEDSDAMRQRVKSLETELAEAKAILEGSAVPDIAKMAKAEREVEEARATIVALEKKVANREQDKDYSFKAYQDASNRAIVLNREARELREQVEVLERKAGDNILKINQVNDQKQRDAENRQTDELRAQLRECQRDLAQARDELRHLKNGRRETRQASVPRSPRTTGVMSPRPNRGVGGGSRGTSPAPTYDAAAGAPGGMVFLNQAPSGSARWPHLRD